MSKKLFLLIVVLLSCFYFKSDIVLASPLVVDIPVSQPTTDESSGWLFLLWENNSTGAITGRYYYFNTTTTLKAGSSNVNSEPWVSIKLSNNGFTSTYYAGTNNTGFTTMFTRDAGGSTSLSTLAYDTSGTGYSMTSNSYTVVGYEYSGYVTLTSDSNISKKVNFAINWGSQTSEYDKLQSILDYIIAIYGDQVDLYNMLVQVFDNTTSIDECLSNLYSYLQFELPNLYDKLLDIDNNFLDTNTHLNEIYKLIQKIFNQYQGSESTDKPSSDSINDLNDIESNLTDKGQNVEDNFSDVNITIDNSANGTLWNIINMFITTNSLVFGLFITMLSLGVVKLLLNR